MQKPFLFLMFLFLPFFTNAQEYPRANEIIQRNDAVEDIRSLVGNLVYFHPSLFHYKSEEAFYALVDSVKADIPPSLTMLELWRRANIIIAFVNDAHTRPFLGTYLADYILGGGKFFPLEASIKQKQITVTHNNGFTHEIENGAIIHQINGIAANEVIATLKLHSNSELDFLDETKISSDFSFFMWLAYGAGDSFRINFQNPGSDLLQDIELAGQTEEAIKAAQNAQEESQVGQEEWSESFNYRQLNPQTAYFRILDFSERLGKSYFKRKYRNAFKAINKLPDVKYLIIDVRGHEGGDPAFGHELAKYFAPHPFQSIKESYWRVSPEFKKAFSLTYIPGIIRWCKPLYFLNKHTKAIWQVKDKGKAIIDYDLIKPFQPAKQFQGEVFCLIDNGTFSAGSLFAGMFQDYKMGTLIGQPSGNLSSFFADPIVTIRLPKSKIRVRISTSYQIRPNGEEGLKTVEPDILLPPTTDALEYTLSSLKSKQEE